VVEPVQSLGDLLGVVPLESHVAEFALDDLFTETSSKQAMELVRSFS
jgi:hypothetical protein